MKWIINCFINYYLWNETSFWEGNFGSTVGSRWFWGFIWGDGGMRLNFSLKMVEEKREIWSKTADYVKNKESKKIQCEIRSKTPQKQQKPQAKIN